MQKNTKKGFSLVEVIVATVILSITVFGVYRLISENTKVVENSNLILQENNLFDVIKNCIENATPTTQEMFLSLGPDKNSCSFQTAEVFNNIDNIDYILGIKTTNNLSSKIIIWDILVSTEFRGTKTQKYVQRK